MGTSEWQNMNKEQFQNYLNENLIKYNLSEKKLGEILGIPQKSINRYRNEGFPERSDRVKAIWEYFHKLEAKESEKEDSSEWELVGYDEEGQPIFLYPADDSEPYPDERIPAGSEKLKFFTPRAQQFIVENYYMIGAITQEELEFISGIKQCGEKDRRKIIEYMESLKDDISMYSMVDMEPDDFETIEPQYDYYTKMIDYQRMVYHFDKYPTSWSNMEDPDTGKINEVFRKKNVIDFSEKNWDVYASGGFFNGYDVINNANVIKCYWKTEWYYLFLYAKMQLYDASCENLGVVEYKGKYLGWNLYKVWKMLEKANPNQ